MRLLDFPQGKDKVLSCKYKEHFVEVATKREYSHLRTKFITAFSKQPFRILKIRFLLRQRQHTDGIKLQKIKLPHIFLPFEIFDRLI